MAQSIVISQGKSFTVELQSMYGSSAYGWCLSTLPKGIILTGTENERIPSPYQIGPINQKFYFSAVSGDLVMTLIFVLAAAFCPADVRDTYTVDVQVVPANPQEFVPYSENAVANVKYGYMCTGQENSPSLKYGYPCAEQENSPSLKYGYPCAEQENLPSLKYGYPCGYNDAATQVNKPFINEIISYNKPFINDGMSVNKPFINGSMPVNKPFINDTNAMNVAMPYGMVHVDDCLHKYGFPNC